LHNKVLSRMTTASEVHEVEHAEEIRVKRETRELRVLEANASLEEERLHLRMETNAGINALRAKFDRSVKEISKMISAL
jgi:hypothetical protein